MKYLYILNYINIHCTLCAKSLGHWSWLWFVADPGKCLRCWPMVTAPYKHLGVALGRSLQGLGIPRNSLRRCNRINPSTTLAQPALPYIVQLIRVCACGPSQKMLNLCLWLCFNFFAGGVRLIIPTWRNEAMVWRRKHNLINCVYLLWETIWISCFCFVLTSCWYLLCTESRTHAWHTQCLTFQSKSVTSGGGPARCHGAQVQPRQLLFRSHNSMTLWQQDVWLCSFNQSDTTFFQDLRFRHVSCMLTCPCVEST